MENKNSLSTIAMVAGLISMILALIGLIAGIFSRAGGWLALIALILGIVGIALGSSAKKNGGKGTAGLVMGIIGLVFSVIVGMSCIICNACNYYKALDVATSIYGDIDTKDLQDSLKELDDLFN